MGASSDDLHGSAPDMCGAALLLIDLINDLQCPGGDHLLPHALPVGRAIAALKRRARGAAQGTALPGPYPAQRGGIARVAAH